MFNIGMYGGSFDPFHLGHMNCIIKAASMCKTLYVVISFSKDRDFVPVEYRYRWILNSTKHLPNVKIILLEDNAKTKEEYNSLNCWENGRNYVLSQIGRNVDVVFCGSDYKDKKIYESLYNTNVFYFDRKEIQISSTQIRQNPFKYWDYIPKIVRPYFCKKVLVIGGESTGKSTIVKNLSEIFNTNYVEEIGRYVCDYAGSEEMMIAEDFEEILLRHRIAELDAIKESNKILFVDTDALTTHFYSSFLSKDAEKEVKLLNLACSISSMNKFDLVFFLEPTVDFVQDGTRSDIIKSDRKKYSEILKSIYEKAGIEFYIVSYPDYIDRINAIEHLVRTKFRL